MKTNKILILSISGCDYEEINSVDFLKNLSKEIAAKVKVNEIKKISHEFSPQGVTVVSMLAESHIALHSWPEYNYLSITVFSCSSRDPEKCLPIIKDNLEHSNIRKQKIENAIN